MHCYVCTKKLTERIYLQDHLLSEQREALVSVQLSSAEITSFLKSEGKHWCLCSRPQQRSPPLSRAKGSCGVCVAVLSRDHLLSQERREAVVSVLPFSAPPFLRAKGSIGVCTVVLGRRAFRNSSNDLEEKLLTVLRCQPVSHC